MWYNNCLKQMILILTLLTKALRWKRREVFLFILGNCYTTLDAKLFEDAVTLLPGYIGTLFNHASLNAPGGLIFMRGMKLKFTGIIFTKKTTKLKRSINRSQARLKGGLHAG